MPEDRRRQDDANEAYDRGQERAREFAEQERRHRDAIAGRDRR